MDGLGSTWTPDGTEPIIAGDALSAPGAVPVRDSASADATGGGGFGSWSPTAADPVLRTGRTSSPADLLGEPRPDDGLGAPGGIGDGTGSGGWTDASTPGAFVLPPMPALGGASEHADALARWMDDDRARSDDGPPPPTVPSPRASRIPARSDAGPAVLRTRIGTPGPAGDEADEEQLDPSLQTQREERAFESW